MQHDTTTSPTERTPEGNRRRVRSTGAVALVAACLLLLSACLSPNQQSALDALNADRKAAGLPALKTQSDAQTKAQAWAEKIARDNRLSHSVLTDGIKVRYCALAENVGYGSSIAEAEAGFMRSAIHRGNILNRAWNGVGVGVAKNGSRFYVVQFFIKTC